MVYGSVDRASDHIAYSHSYEVYESLDHAIDLTFTRSFTVYGLLNHASDIFLAQYKYVYGKKKVYHNPLFLCLKYYVNFNYGYSRRIRFAGGDGVIVSSSSPSSSR